MKKSQQLIRFIDEQKIFDEKEQNVKDKIKETLKTVLILNEYDENLTASVDILDFGVSKDQTILSIWFDYLGCDEEHISFPLSYLDNNNWENDYKATLEVNKLHAEALHLNSRFDSEYKKYIELKRKFGNTK